MVVRFWLQLPLRRNMGMSCDGTSEPRVYRSTTTAMPLTPDETISKRLMVKRATKRPEQVQHAQTKSSVLSRISGCGLILRNSNAQTTRDPHKRDSAD